MPGCNRICFCFTCFICFASRCVNLIAVRKNSTSLLIQKDAKSGSCPNHFLKTHPFTGFSALPKWSRKNKDLNPYGGGNKTPWWEHLHFVGTCAVGSCPTSVLDPSIISNTNITTYFIYIYIHNRPFCFFLRPCGVLHRLPLGFPRLLFVVCFVGCEAELHGGEPHGALLPGALRGLGLRAGGADLGAEPLGDQALRPLRPLAPGAGAVFLATGGEALG